MNINPAYAGSSEFMEISANFRNQWIGWSDAPTNFTATISAPFTLMGMSHGAGLIMKRNNFPINSDTQLKLAYAFQRKTNIGDGKIGIGISGGLNNSVFDGTKLNGTGDPIVPTTKITNNIFDIDLGVYYKSEKIYMGLSVAHLLTGQRDYQIGSDVYPLKQTYYATAGYYLQTSNPLIMVVPCFLLQSDGATSSLNFNTNIIYNNRVWGGISYTPGDAITGMFGLELLPGVKFGFSYDYNTSYLHKAADGSIEVVVLYGFKLKKEKLPQRYKSIRFL